MMNYKLLLSIFGMLLPTAFSWGQVVFTDPPFPKIDEPVTVFFDATQGAGGLADCDCDVYIHSGLITSESVSPSDWKYVQMEWGVANPDWQLTPVPGEPNLYSYDITPSIQEYYGASAGDEVLQMAFVFRNADGSLEGKGDGGTDIFYDVFPADLPFTGLLLAPEQRVQIAQIGEDIPIRYIVSEEATIQVFDNDELVTETTGTQLEFTLEVTEPGLHRIDIVADNGATQISDGFGFATVQDLPAADPPPGAERGITYLGDNALRLVLYAPMKEYAFVIGDFNDWTPTQMNRSVDGNTYWIEIDGLTPGDYYAFQYLVSGDFRIPDPYSELILDQFNDPFISEATWPGLPAFPSEFTDGQATLVQPGAPQYDWQVTDFERPANEELVIYELLMRDFIGAQNYQTLLDTLDYLERLGVNAIEFMPVNEFGGNQSWGYNPSFHMALDKAYGTPEAFKAVVDECHARGIAVILDVVYNHADGLNPYVRLYWDSANNRPAADSPFFNPEATHPFNVFYDFNHESPDTRDYMDRMIRYWLEEYRVDGYRFDLSKGFTQVNTGGDVGAWSAYDASRIAIIKHYADVMWATSPGSYATLEHFGANDEEIELSNYGCMLWGNMNFQYNEASMGYPNNLSGASYLDRGWGEPHLISYMESHDEERLMFKNVTYGNSSPDGSYDVTDVITALRRQELVTAFHYTIPGPKMLWQFGEVGYDFSIFTCEDGTVNLGDDGCKLSPKPIRWDYQDLPNRRRLFNITSALIQLKTDYDVFNTTDIQHRLVQSDWKTLFLFGDEMDVVVQGNFNVVDDEIEEPFPGTGTWYDYFSGDSLMVTDPNASLTFGPGEYRLYTSVRLDEPPGGFPTSTVVLVDDYFDLKAAPNPAVDQMTITFELPQGGPMRLDLYDAQGRRLRTLHEGRLPGGVHTLDLAAGSLPPGLYTLRFSAENKVETERLVIVR